MRLVKECVRKVNEVPRKCLLLTEVNDNDAHILELCNMGRAYEYDDDENEIEAWVAI